MFILPFCCLLICHLSVLPPTQAPTHHPPPTYTPSTPTHTSSTHSPISHLSLSLLPPHTPSTHPLSIYTHTRLPINQSFPHLPIYSSIHPSSTHPPSSAHQFDSHTVLMGSFCLPNPRPSPQVTVKASHSSCSPEGHHPVSQT